MGPYQIVCPDCGLSGELTRSAEGETPTFPAGEAAKCNVHGVDVVRQSCPTLDAETKRVMRGEPSPRP